MGKLTVKEFATINKISVQSVYKRISTGALEVREVNNIKYIIINDSIDYEKMFNELKLKYQLLEEKIKFKEEIINELKDKQRLFNLLLTAPPPEKKKKKKKHK